MISLSNLEGMAFVITLLASFSSGIGAVHSALSLADRIKLKNPPLWAILGKPESSFFNPLINIAIVRTVVMPNKDIHQDIELRNLRRLARIWFAAQVVCLLLFMHLVSKIGITA